MNATKPGWIEQRCHGLTKRKGAHRARHFPTALVALLFLGSGLLPASGQSGIDGFNPNANGRVRAIAFQTDGKAIIGGDFTNVSGTNYSRIARLNTNGGLDTTFSNSLANAEVLCLAVLPTGKILAGGNFTSLGGQARSFLGRLNANGSLDTNFNLAANGQVRDLAVQADGKILVGGGFTQLGGSNRTYLARLNTNGTVDTTFNPGASAQVNTLALQANGKIIVGGFFTNLAGTTCNRIGRLNTNGTLDTAFSPGASDTLWRLAVQADGKILAAGDFTNLLGQVRHRLGRLNTNGTLDATFDPGANGTVNSFAFQADGKILAGGNFTTLGGGGTGTTARSNLGRLNTNGTPDTNFNFSAGAELYALATQADGRIAVGGNFTTLGGQTRNRIGRLGFQTNDNFAAATLITGDNITMTVSNMGATKETGEPDHSISTGGASVWWKWTAPTNSWVVLSVTKPFFPMIAAVYTGTSVTNMTKITSGLSAGGPDSDVFLTFNATQGTNYYFAVEGYFGAEGSDLLFHLDSEPTTSPPPNDNFASATPIGGSTVSLTGSNGGATRETNEPDFYNGFVNLGRSVWWTWTAPSNLTATISTAGSSFDTVLMVFTGTNLTNLNLVARNDDSDGITSSATFSAGAGTPYRICVDGWNAASGTIALNLRTIPPTFPAPPINDNFASAIKITSNSFQTNASNLGATLEVGEFLADGASVWWFFVAPTNGQMEVSVDGGAIPLQFGVYQGTSVASLNEIAKNNYGGVGGSLSTFLPNRLRFDVLGGTTNYILVDEFLGARGSFNLGVSFTPVQSNNTFAARIVLSPAVTNVSGSNVGATSELNEPNTFSGSDNSVWWSWTPNKSGTAILSTFNSSFDTVLAVYSNTVLSSLALVATNDDAYDFGSKKDPASRVQFQAASNTAYQIRVTGAANASGSIALNFVKVAIENILSIQRTIQPDRSVDFSVAVGLRNLRTNQTGALRIRLVARAGYSVLDYLRNDLDFISTLNVPDEQLAIIDVSPTTLAATSVTNFTLAGHCPPPVEYGKWGYGRGVEAILEEQVGSAWQFCDGRLIVVGEWPVVGGAAGPGGGVATITSGLGGTASHPGYLQVHPGPLSALRLGGAWRISPTNYGEKTELRFYTNYTTSALVLAVQSTNFSIDTKSLPGFTPPPNQNIFLTNGGVANLDLIYSVTPPRLILDFTSGLGLTGTVATAYRIERASGVVSNWATVTNSFSLGAGTNWISNTAPVATTNRFYRAVWLPDE